MVTDRACDTGSIGGVAPSPTSAAGTGRMVTQQLAQIIIQERRPEVDGLHLEQQAQTDGPVTVTGLRFLTSATDLPARAIQEPGTTIRVWNVHTLSCLTQQGPSPVRGRPARHTP